MTANAAQIEYWNGAPGEKWVKNQAAMDASLADATAGLLRLAAIRPGERVLDIGCGSGQTSLLAAQAVGAGGQAINYAPSGSVHGPILGARIDPPGPGAGATLGSRGTTAATTVPG